MLLDPNKRMVSVIMERLKEDPNKEKFKSKHDGDPADAKAEMLEHFTGAKPEDLEEAKESSEEESLEEQGCIEAAHQMIAAFTNKDAEALHKALQDYLEIEKSY